MTQSKPPIVDIASLVDGTNAGSVAAEIGRSCREFGFFYIVGHGIDEKLIEQLISLSRKFFALDVDEKLRIRMSQAGSAWRGYFPIGGELTSGRPDVKEGLYFGSELNAGHPKVAAGVPMHGQNLFPSIEGFRTTLLDYLDQMTRLGHLLMEAISLSLDLPRQRFRETLTFDPLILFRVFHYPAVVAATDAWGVGEHTDYGLLSMLRQDESGGLQIKSNEQWIDAPPVPNSFVCNIGDMLECLTQGLYRSTPHRVRCPHVAGRISLPFFFDPAFDASIGPVIERPEVNAETYTRWDGMDVRAFTGRYGDYLLQKVARVFPELSQDQS